MEAGGVSSGRDPVPYFSDELLEKAKTARMYIENLYRAQGQNFRERRDRYVVISDRTFLRRTPVTSIPFVNIILVVSDAMLLA